MGYWNQWAPYVPVAERRAKAKREAAKLGKKGETLEPVAIEGRTIARSFWGKAWCTHLESYSDYANRLPRGRSYLSNGLVVDLKVERGRVRARVYGSSLYAIDVRVRPLAATRWKTIRSACSGRIDSLVELLQGRIADDVMRRMCDRATGLFPAPAEIELECSCPDYAGMCKHIAAALYGVGARLDAAPELLFKLRGVDHLDLVAEATSVALPQAAPAADALQGEDLSALFGIELAPPADALFAAGDEVHDADLIAIGVPRMVFTPWIAEGLLERTKKRGVYRATAALDARVVAFLEAQALG